MNRADAELIEMIDEYAEHVAADGDTFLRVLLGADPRKPHETAIERESAAHVIAALMRECVTGSELASLLCRDDALALIREYAAGPRPHRAKVAAMSALADADTP